MTEREITVQFDRRIAELIDFLAANYGYENAKDFIEMLALASLFEALEGASPTSAQH